MFNVLIVTISRLRQDVSVLIALIFVPILIIAAFTHFGLSTPTTSSLKVSVFSDTQNDVLLTHLDETFVVYHVDSEAALQEMVQSHRTAAGIHIASGDLVSVFALDASVGEYVVAQTYLEKTPEPLTPADPLPQVREGLINFLINYMMFSMIFIASDVVSLKKIHVLKRMHTLPLTNGQIFGGLTGAFLFFLLIQLVVVQGVAFFMLGLPIASDLILGTGVLIVMMALVLSLGLLVTRITSNVSMVPLVCNAIMIPMMMVSGTFMPLNPDLFISRLKVLSPQYWVVDALSLINNGNLAIDVLPHFMVLLVMTGLVFTLATIGRTQEVGDGG